MPKYDEAGSLMTKARELIQADSKSISELHTLTGLPFYWLRKFRNNEIPNPSVNRVQFLYEKLSGKQLSC